MMTSFCGTPAKSKKEFCSFYLQEHCNCEDLRPRWQLYPLKSLSHWQTFSTQSPESEQMFSFSNPGHSSHSAIKFEIVFKVNFENQKIVYHFDSLCSKEDSICHVHLEWTICSRMHPKPRYLQHHHEVDQSQGSDGTWFVVQMGIPSKLLGYPSHHWLWSNVHRCHLCWTSCICFSNI